MNYRAIFAGFAAAFVLSAPAVLAEDRRGGNSDDRAYTRTPIKHLVVIFQENVSFDHYFGTYPVAQNKPGETPFRASRRNADEHQHAADAARSHPSFQPAHRAST